MIPAQERVVKPIFNLPLAGGLQRLFYLVLLFLSLPASAQNSCATPGGDGNNPTVSGIINTYYTPTDGSFDSNTIAIALSNPRGAGAVLSPGDLVLVIQMQCADLDLSDSGAYGDGVPGEPASGSIDPVGACLAGRYEFVRAGPATTNSNLDLSETPLSEMYQQLPATNTQGRRTFQVVRVPQYLNAAMSGNVLSSVWDGFTGGLVVIDAALEFDFNGFAIDVDGAGFRGGGGLTDSANDAVERFRWDDRSRHGSKGEGIAGTPRWVSEKRSFSDGAIAAVTDLGSGWGGYPTGTGSTGDFARGAPGNAGGGGTFWDGASDNGGGGGGGNAGAGGRGAAGWRSAGYAGILSDYSNIPEKKWGFGGASVPGSVTRLVMGGGGGAGDNNNNSLGPESSGAAGGGIVMVRAETLSGNGQIRARGGRATDNPDNDAAGGGGAGGSVLVVATSWSVALAVDASGGRGGDAWVDGASAHGAGGGGSGGLILTTAAPVSAIANGGDTGLTTTADSPPGGAAHGAETGEGGNSIVFLPEDDDPGTNVGRTCRADLAVVKTNPASPLISGQTTSYTLVITNNGPLSADNAVLSDVPSAGLTLDSIACTFASGGAVCPLGPFTIADLLGPGIVLPVLPNGGSLTFVVQATVTASGV